eukprot:7895018-Pyramimonas_sp.AAC.2
MLSCSIRSLSSGSILPQLGTLATDTPRQGGVIRMTSGRSDRIISHVFVLFRARRRPQPVQIHGSRYGKAPARYL